LKAISIPGDILDANFPERLIEETVKAYGKINHIVNNAGFTYDGMIHKITDKQWDVMLACHNTAPFKIIRAAAKYLRKKDGQNKTIVNISSTSGLHGNVGQANYATAKAGIVGLTKTVAKEWGGFGVRCNTVAFGFVDTRLTRAKEAGATIEVEGKKVALGIPTGSATGARANPYAAIPLGRPASADEVAGSVLTLCTPLTSYISGHTLEVTGGAGNFIFCLIYMKFFFNFFFFFFFFFFFLN
jgi:3-oxoacyl-[acyl-carrier protein] reductase